MRNLFRLDKENKAIKNRIIRNIRNVFRLEKENKRINGQIIKDIRNLFEHEEEDSYKPVRIGKFRSKNYIEYKSKGDRKTLSAEE